MQVTIIQATQLVAGVATLNGKEHSGDPLVCGLGDVIEVPTRTGEWLIQNKAAKAGEVEGGSIVVADETELAGCPNADDIIEAGITTVDALHALMTEHGDDWFQQVKGIGKGTAPKVVQWLTEKLSPEND